MPLVSIITPLHNKGRYIAATIQSVLAQTFSDWEMVVVENGSTDDGPKIVQTICDPRVRLLKSARLGPGAARNFGLGHASGEWILFLDGDDLLQDEFIASLLRRARETPDADIIVSPWKEFVDNSISGEVVRYPKGWKTNHRNLLDQAFACAPWAVHCALIRRRSIAVNLHWPEHLDAFPSEDSAFWFPLLLKCKVCWCDYVGALYRLSSQDGRNNTPDIESWIEGLIRILDRNLTVLLQAGKEPTRSQLMQALTMLEEKYWIAKRTRVIAAARLAEESARGWLARIDNPTWPLLLRKCLGIGPALTFEKAWSRVCGVLTLRSQRQV